MKLFRKGPDGGAGSGVTGYYIVEIKSLFSIVLLRFAKGAPREAFHTHAFNALTLWLSGAVIEQHWNGDRKAFRGGQWKFTGRDTFHKVIALRDTWALSFRGPWAPTWLEDRKGTLVTLANGRVVVA